MEVVLQGHLIKVRTGKQTGDLTTSSVLEHDLYVNEEWTTECEEKKEIVKRGKIKGFSNKSRKRLIELVASCGKIEKAVFLTLTYGQNWPSNTEAKRHIKVFLQRVERLFPKSSGIWRMEFQDRGAPHFHILFFNLLWWEKREVAKAWLEVIGDDFGDWSHGALKPPFTRIELVNNAKQAMIYISKYIAKETGSDAEGGFNYVPYLPAAETGRLWGIFHKLLLPLAIKTVIKFFSLEKLDLLRFIASFNRIMSKKKKIWLGAKMCYDGYHAGNSYVRAYSERVQGFTLFSEDVDHWQETIERIIAI